MVTLEPNSSFSKFFMHSQTKYSTLDYMIRNNADSLNGFKIEDYFAKMYKAVSNAQQILIKDYMYFSPQEILSSVYSKEKQEDSSVLGWYGVSLVCRWCVSGVSLVYLWCVAGVSLVCRWCVVGVSLVCRWCLWCVSGRAFPDISRLL